MSKDSRSTTNSSIGPQLSLAPAIAYSLRKILRRNLDRLQFKASVKLGVTADPLCDLNTTLKSLYPNVAKRDAVLAELSRLTAEHQALSSQGNRHRQELTRLEEQLFGLLGFQLQATDHQRTVLIVDDTPENLRLLSSALTQAGYDVRSIVRGQLALSKIRSIMPDVILLDVMMPDISGYEICERFKADTLIRDIPVIFVSAAGDALDKVRAFEVGGVDYITKPFQVEEVLARVEHQINTRTLQRRLEEQAVRLQQEIRDRRQAEEQYRSIFENAVDGIFQISPTGRYLSANPALARIYGYESPQALMLQVTDVGRQLYIQPQRRAELIAYLQRFETVSDFESQVYRRDGSIIWISEDVRTVKDTDGTILYYEGTVKDITERKQTEAELYQARRKTEQLLLNILPQQIAERLKKGQTVIADYCEAATVLFADIVDFTAFSAQVDPSRLITLLNQIFSAFDDLVEQRGLEKIKTIGDAYMVVGGVPTPDPDHAEAIADLALAMQQIIIQFQRDFHIPFRLRIGINTGPVVAGVIGTKKFSYDLWGDTVNIASRMESEGMAGKIQVTETTYQLLKNEYLLEPRGSIPIKGRGEMKTYWLIGSDEESAF